MRLFRRALFCLVVGVTAFGMAGWAFRPRLNWEVALGSGSASSFVAGPGKLDAKHPLWLTLEATSIGVRNTWLCIEPSDGGILNNVEAPGPGTSVLVPSVDGDGRLHVFSVRDLMGNPDTRVDIYAANDSKPQTSSALKGYFRTGRGGRVAWKIDETPDGVTVRVVDVFTGESFEREFKGPYPFRDTAVNDEGLCAVYVGPRLEPTTPIGVEIWELRSGKRTATVTFARLGESIKGATFGELTFSGDGSTVEASVREEENFEVVRQYSIEVQTGSLSVTEPRNPAPPTDHKGAKVALRAEQDGLEVWVAESRDPFAASWLIRPRGAVRNDWHRIAFPDGVRPMDVPFKGDAVATTVSFAESPRTLVFQVEPREEGELPHSLLARWVPWLELESGAFWLDSKTNAWRNVGCAPGIKAAMVHGAAYLVTYVSPDGRSLLQSWPLPPRDPKWPALGVAALCTAGTWWACAKRYRRRMNRAATSAVAT